MKEWVVTATYRIIVAAEVCAETEEAAEEKAFKLFSENFDDYVSDCDILAPPRWRSGCRRNN